MSVRIRTGYSFRNAFGHLPDVMEAIKSAGLSKAPITDTSSTFGFVRWSKLCKNNEIDPVFGVELAVAKSLNEKKPRVDYWTFIAKDGLEPLHALIEIATTQFRYQPTLSLDQAIAAEGVMKIVGHLTDPYEVPVDDEDLFFALSPSLSRGQFARQKARGVKFVVASDNRFPTQRDQAAYEVICGRNASTQSYNQTIMHDDDWEKAIKKTRASEEDISQAKANREFIFSQSTAKLISGTLLSPERPETLQVMCEKGAQKLGVDLKDPVYSARLERELKLIDEKNFSDYFYIIADVCQWARARMAVGPARGSSCGSLVCYLLEITTVDPIPYGLIFERFIDVNRDDLPDIDIDFSDKRRQLVFDYMAEKYGADHVARLGTVSMYKPKSCLNEAGAALDIPPWDIDKVSDSIIERSGGDSRALQAVEDTLNDTEVGRSLLEKWPEVRIAGRMEGHPRHSSQHAAGIIVTEKPVRAYVALDNRTGAIQCDKKDAEDLDLLKIDALGLTQLSVFEDALELAGFKHDYLESVPLDDPEAFKILNDGKYSGIFQFNGVALQSVTDQIHVNSLEDIISITALARPGPLNTGGTNEWIKRRAKNVQPAGLHPMLDELTKDTLGIMTYQEQVMRVVREMGNLSWAETSAIRKTMSKTLGEEYFDQFKKNFVAGAKENGVPEELAVEIWKQINTFGSWAFNRSHAVAYGIVSYWCCWLKAHYPLEFAAATLGSMKLPENQIKFLRELSKEGITYVPADIDYSTDKWTVGLKGNEKVLVGPLSNVKGIGPKLEQQIMEARQKGEAIPSKAQKLLKDPETKVDSIWPITDRLLKILPDPREANIFTAPRPIIDVQVNGTLQTEVLVFCTISQIKPKDENEDINIAKRGYAFKGPSKALNLRLTDDTDTVFAKINRYDYDRLAKPIIERGRAGKCLYAIKGEIPKGFRMISVKQVRYLGDLEKDDE